MPLTFFSLLRSIGANSVRAQDPAAVGGIYRRIPTMVTVVVICVRVWLWCRTTWRMIYLAAIRVRKMHNVVTKRRRVIPFSEGPRTATEKLAKYNHISSSSSSE
ncbi:hypothetical protein GE21DRAFT_7269 [Neurospora crassa]|uniref:Uncharacterized protein n=2 Tax=Neurospora crassa TaxID=5141 RepID=Q1K7Z1_NEUCR|nr:hypothetical protein NCU03707 [Neurospora crassa OR74A]EAA32247.1 hypothetical protein NCU03707 [Neurospora crassa OR74A]KHE88925.1 hypothetical protein GE21DRAFT_7269 [Neurospora crassa]CAC28860.2 hypothetical protein [Neurospora crassa]|eukprot:XP_961483.1 hypothetical protein NCU03707 [Neurospora crassa OR74A]